MLVTVNILWGKHPWQDAPTLNLTDIEPKYFPEYVMTGTVEVEVGEPPAPEAFFAPQVAKTRAEIQHHYDAIEKLNEKLQSLTAIEFKP